MTKHDRDALKLALEQARAADADHDEQIRFLLREVISSASSMCCVSLVTCASGTVVMAWPVSSGYMAAMRSCAIGSTSSPQIVRRRLHATIIHVAVPSARNCRRCGSGRVREQAMADFKRDKD